MVILGAWRQKTHGTYILVGEFELADLRTFPKNILFYRSYSMIWRSSGDFPTVLQCYIALVGFFKINLFTYLYMAALGLGCCMQASSSCSERGLLLVSVHGLLIVVASLVAEHGLQVRGLQQLWLVGSRAQAQQLWRTGLVALQHVGSSRPRGRTRVPCIGRWILNHCATREVQPQCFLILIFFARYSILVNKK